MMNTWLVNKKPISFKLYVKVLFNNNNDLFYTILYNVYKQYKKLLLSELKKSLLQIVIFPQVTLQNEFGTLKIPVDVSLSESSQVNYEVVQVLTFKN